METAGASGHSPTPAKERAESAEDRRERLLRDIRDRALVTTWRDPVNVRGLLSDAKLNPDDYSLDGTGTTLWSNLIPVLRGRMELAQVLRAAERRIGGPLRETARELAESFAEEEKRHADSIEYDRMRTQLLGDVQGALALLGEASSYLSTLLMPDHPSAARIAGMRSWIVGCVKAVSRAQKSGAQISHGDEVAHLGEITVHLAAVSDDFRLYASSLERFRSADQPAVRQAVRSTAAADEDEERLLSYRRRLRNSVQLLMSDLETES